MLHGLSGSTVQSALCIWLQAVLDSLCFTIVMPTASHYMQELHVPDAKEVTGLMVGLSPLGKAILVLPSTWFVFRFGLRRYFILSCTAQCVGMILYAGASIWSCWEMALAGRFLAGALGGQLLVSSFVARAYDSNNRADAMLWTQLGQVAAYSLGPFSGGFLSFACDQILRKHAEEQQLCGNTAPGWVLAACALLLLLFVLCSFVEPRAIYGGDEAALVTQAFRPLGLGISLFAVFVVQGIVGSWELYTATMSQELWKFSVFQGASVVAGLLLLWLPLLLIGAHVSHTVSDRRANQALTVIFLPCSFLFLLSHSNKEAYLAGSVGLVIFTQLVAGFAKALCTKLVPDKFQNAAAGAVAIASALGRAAGPLLATLRGGRWWAWAVVMVMFLQNAAMGFGYSEL